MALVGVAVGCQLCMACVASPARESQLIGLIGHDSIAEDLPLSEIGQGRQFQVKFERPRS